VLVFTGSLQAIAARIDGFVDNTDLSCLNSTPSEFRNLCPAHQPKPESPFVYEHSRGVIGFEHLTLDLDKSMLTSDKANVKIGWRDKVVVKITAVQP